MKYHIIFPICEVKKTQSHRIVVVRGWGKREEKGMVKAGLLTTKLLSDGSQHLWYATV
jgi:hypothetical protein